MIAAGLMLADFLRREPALIGIHVGCEQGVRSTRAASAAFTRASPQPQSEAEVYSAAVSLAVLANREVR